MHFCETAQQTITLGQSSDRSWWFGRFPADDSEGFAYYITVQVKFASSLMKNTI